MAANVAHLDYDRQTTGERLRRRRQEIGLTQSEVAWMAGITQAALSNYENGKRDLPIPSLLALAGVLRTTPMEFIPALQPDRFEGLE
ncbi:MAG: helix-turn-helix domain-containing protein [Dehalococcoidia bacterium]|nr:helix-turn-helix domain-containing protein [Dehalococcoidia bacterium]